jgi:hypothetical protein
MMSRSNMEEQSKENVLTKTKLEDENDIYPSMKISIREMKGKLTGNDTPPLVTKSAGDWRIEVHVGDLIDTIKVSVVDDKQKTTINLLQNKSPVPPTLDTKTTSKTVKKLNENMKNKTAEVSDLKSRNNQLADELAVLQNSINSKTANVKDDESDRYQS